MEEEKKCRFCGASGSGHYCHQCGQSFTVKRLSAKSIFHEIIHFFTHFDKGFPYTVKRLLQAPGAMQREYVEGYRTRYQKPFSMYFICASFAALAIYWINNTLLHYFNGGDTHEALFFHKYWALLQVCLLPLYSFTMYLIFKKSGYNYGEVIVLQLYTFSFLFLVLTVIHLFKFAAPHLQTRYIEVPVITIYCVLTNIYFFNKTVKWVVVLKTIVAIGLNYFIASSLQDMLVQLFS